MTRYICDCEKLELPRAYYCAACNAYKKLEADVVELTDNLQLMKDESLLFKVNVGLARDLKKAIAERDAAVARYEYVRRLNVQQFKKFWDRNLAGERFDDMVDAAIDAARSEA